jgi:cytochrome b561
MFALDSFAPGLTLIQQIGAFLMHLVPSFVLLALLILAWQQELVGGSLFVLIGIIFSPIIYQHNFRMNHSVMISLQVILLITFPFIVTGTLFIIHHFLARKAKKE